MCIWRPLRLEALCPHSSHTNSFSPRCLKASCRRSSVRDRKHLEQVEHCKATGEESVRIGVHPPQTHTQPFPSCSRELPAEAKAAPPAQRHPVRWDSPTEMKCWPVLGSLGCSCIQKSQFRVALCPTPSLTEPDVILCHSLGQVHTQEHTLPKTPSHYRVGLGCAVQLYHVALQVLLLHELL